MARGTIPFLKLGFRTVRFQPTKVEKALQKREVREVGEINKQLGDLVTLAQQQTDLFRRLLERERML